MDLNWVKSSFCPSNGTCVEVAKDGDGNLLMRDSKNPHGPKLSFTPAEWDAFLGGAKNGEFDTLAG